MSRNLNDGFKDYLGDGVYAHFDGGQIWLTTLEGMWIALEPEVLAALDRYKADLIRELAAQTKEVP